MREYNENLINSAIEKAKKIPRKSALRKVERKNQLRRPVFAVKYDPRLPSITSIQAKHWRAMSSQDQYLSTCFPEPPLTGFKKQKNLRDILIRAKVPEPNRLRPKREMKGVFKCGYQCTACPYIQEVKDIKSNKFHWKINKNLSCSSYNIIYLIECKKETCKRNQNFRYIGESKRPLRNRFADHRGYVVNHVDTATVAHFTSAGHSLSDMTVTLLEQVKNNDESYRKEREKFFIRKFDTYNCGLNRKQ